MNDVPELTLTITPPPEARISGMTACIAMMGANTLSRKMLVEGVRIDSLRLRAVTTTRSIQFGRQLHNQIRPARPRSAPAAIAQSGLHRVQ